MATQTAVKEKPILMSGPMVRAILDGRKTVTRRVVNPQPESDQPEMSDGIIRWKHRVMTVEEMLDRCPYGQPGDRLWVRETFSPCSCPRCEEAWPKAGPHPQVTYAVDDNRWVNKPSIFMPRWASRLTLEVVSVRVERLQEITEEDAQAEGFERDFRPDGSEYGAGLVYAVNEFAALWDKLNASRGFSWESNPWVWRVEFKRL